MLLSKKLVVLLLVVTCGTFTMAQGVLKPIAKAATKSKTYHVPTKKALRLGGLSYVKPSSQIGYEILNGTKNSFIGLDEHIRFEQVAARTRFLGNNLSRFIAREVVSPVPVPPESFAGFYADFPRAWQKASTHIVRLEVLLEAAYGKSDQFSGHFVQSFDEVMDLAISPVQYPWSARQALEWAMSEALEEKTGFFVIQVAGNGHRPKDTLLLDLEQGQYISYNHSLGNQWAYITQTNQKRVECMPVDMQRFPTAQDRRTTQGIILQVNEDIRTFSVSVNGRSWKSYHLNIKEAETDHEAVYGMNIWDAWNKGYYILQKGEDWLFAAGPGKPLFNSTQEVDEYLQQQVELTTP